MGFYIFIYCCNIHYSISFAPLTSHAQAHLNTLCVVKRLCFRIRRFVFEHFRLSRFNLKTQKKPIDPLFLIRRLCTRNKSSSLTRGSECDPQIIIITLSSSTTKFHHRILKIYSQDTNRSVVTRLPALLSLIITSSLEDSHRSPSLI